MTRPHSGPDNPSRYQLPQHVSEDRRRGRQFTIEINRENYKLSHDEGLPGGSAAQLPVSIAPWPGITRTRRWIGRLISMLPPREVFLSELPPEERMTWPKFFRHATHAGSLKLRLAYVRLTNLDLRPSSTAAYERIMGTIPPPRVKNYWLEDQDFARQRLAGVNPMAIERCVELPHDTLVSSAQRFLEEVHGTTFNRAMDSGRLYLTEYPMLWDQAIQSSVRRGAKLAAPTCVFYVDDHDKLMPVAIQIKPQDVYTDNPVFTPISPLWAWRLARAHVQAADSHYHESISHLLDTHLVSEIFALATHRNLHPDHPVSQLLVPHFEHTLAINEQASKNLLAAHGEIARCMAAKHTGNINLVRFRWSTWRWQDHGLHENLAQRGVQELPGYLYRDDAAEVLRAIDDYVRGILQIWYTTDDDVRSDTELQSWVAEIASPSGGRVEGFPDVVTSCEELFAIMANVVFRATAQHAAVNNGQFSAYGWVPNAPAAVYADLPGTASDEISQAKFYASLPNRERAFAQTGLAWLLSEPTMGSILRVGEVDAFSREHCYEAFRTVGRFRRQLRAISDDIDERNEDIGYEYNFLKPQNIDHSISI